MKRHVKFISVISEKGGVGKTTTIFNLAGALAVKHNKKVLVVDFDPQQNLSQSFGYIADKNKTVAELVKNELEPFPTMNEYDYEHLIRHSDFGVDFIPALIKSINQLPMLITDEDIFAIKNAFSHNMFDDYDYIFFDCKNSLNGYLTPLILTASDYVITPTECGQYSFYGIPSVIKLIESIQRRTNADLKFLGIVVNKRASNISISATVNESIKSGYKDYLFQTFIPYRLSQTENAVNSHKPCVIAKDKYGKLNTLAGFYFELSKEFIERIEIAEREG